MARTLSSPRLIITAGFAMFSMFFGSGNLVYPLITGAATAGQTLWAIMGFLVTAVSLPFLGLTAMVLYEGDYHAFFGKLGRIATFALVFMMLALMGPFGVIPRCITVAFGGVAPMVPSLNFSAFSIGFCLLTAALIWQRNRIVDIIALFLTPFKFGSIVILILLGLWFNHSLPIDSAMPAREAFTSGLFEGYQTMDLMAAFFFGCTIYEYLRMRLQSHFGYVDKARLFKLSLYASLFGGLLLSLVYIGFLFLGASYHAVIASIEPEFMLATIAQEALGNYGMPVVGLTLAVSCLATATVLATLFVDFLKEDICQNRLSRPVGISLTLVVTFVVSLFGFQSIRTALGAILSWTYPFLVVYTLVSIYSCLRQSQKAHATAKSTSVT
jgi:LIVCS family branched-chain amino acid:cation transporter